MLTIRDGGPADARLVLGFFDEAVEWLVARGQTGQWGTEPFSSKDARVVRMTESAAGGGLRIAELDGEPAGAIVIGARPSHVAPADVSERYIEALVSSRRFAGNDVGGALVRRAVEETRAAGISLLRVDCWAGAPTLVAWYEAQGFRRSGTFMVGDWAGQVFSMELD
jgi:GNAT superfamily N-acetyltransferase